jgi:hypothetical protein
VHAGAAGIAMIVLILAGCGRHGVTLSDNVGDLHIDFNPFHAAKNALHSPYVQGAAVTVHADLHGWHSDTSRWRITSSRPEVFAVLSEEHSLSSDSLHADCVARAEGTAVIQVWDGDGDLVHGAEIEVVRPDRVDLLAYGLLLIGRDDAQARVSEARILAGGDATFLVHYFRGSRPLHGNGVLATVPSVNIVATARQSYLFENQEWLTIGASAAGNGQVELRVAGATLGWLPVVAVPEAEIARIAVEGEDEGRADADEILVAFGRSFDGLGRPIYGANYDWTLAGLSQGQGDLFKYNFARGAYKRLDARIDGHLASATIQASDGYVSSSDFIGCRVAAGSRRPLASCIALVLTLAAVAGWRAGRARRHRWAIRCLRRNRSRGTFMEGERSAGGPRRDR